MSAHEKEAMSDHKKNTESKKRAGKLEKKNTESKKRAGKLENQCSSKQFVKLKGKIKTAQLKPEDAGAALSSLGTACLMHK